MSEDLCKLVRDAQSKPIEIAGVRTDITEGKRDAELLRHDSEEEVRLRKVKIIKELVAFLLLGVLFFAVDYAFNLSEGIFEFVWKHRDTPLDEFCISLTVFGPFFAIFSYRRWREVRIEIIKHRQAQEALWILHGELEKRVQQRTVELVKVNEALQGEITERKRAEEGLEHKQAELQMILDTVPAMIFYKDRQHRLLRVNEAAMRAHARRAEDFVGKTDAELGLPHAEQYARDEEEIAATGQPKFNIIEPVLTATGTRWFQTDKFPIRDAAGSITGFIGVSLDITERKRAEADLEKTHKELVESSRLAGMAEVATGVLHNVGNVLNSVNVASLCLADSLRRSKGNNLSRVVTLLREHEKDLGDFFTNDSKGRQLPGYLAVLDQHLAGERADALKELAQLQKNIEHIKQVVGMQQRFAKTSRVTEIIKVTDLVEDALGMNLSELARQDIQVIKEFEDLPFVTVERHKALQILVNLVRNAEQACAASEAQEKKLTIRIINGKDCVRVAVSDNGIGILPENLARIFSHGFTTKKDGHGFGLHSAAIAATEMGGSLTIHSDGPGKGATFTLELPNLQ